MDGYRQMRPETMGLRAMPSRSLYPCNAPMVVAQLKRARQRCTSPPHTRLERADVELTAQPLQTWLGEYHELCEPDGMSCIQVYIHNHHCTLVKLVLGAAA